MRALTFAVACVAAPVWAQAPAPVIAAFAACTGDGTALSDRVAQLRDAGWRDVTPEQAPAAAQALAPWQLIRLGGMTDRPVAERAALLMQAAENMQGFIGRGLGNEFWLVSADDTSWMNISEVRPDMIICQIAARVQDADLSSALSLPAVTQEVDGASIVYFSKTGDRVHALTLVTFAEGYFGDIATLPILNTPPVTGTAE